MIQRRIKRVLQLGGGLLDKGAPGGPFSKVVNTPEQDFPIDPNDVLLVISVEKDEHGGFVISLNNKTQNVIKKFSRKIETNDVFPIGNFFIGSEKYIVSLMVKIEGNDFSFSFISVLPGTSPKAMKFGNDLRIGDEAIVSYLA
jgi:hypothetical protein